MCDNIDALHRKYFEDLPQSRSKTFLYWAAAICIIIFLLTNDISFADTKAFLKDIGIVQLDFTTTFIRKSAHFLIYGGLTFLLIQAWYINFAIIVVPLIACIDEISQWFSTNRTARISDVGIDILGMIAALIIYSLWRRLRTESKY